KEISASSIVVYDTRLLWAIKNESREENLSQKEVDDIIQRIESHNIEDRKTEKQHVENIHKTIFEKRLKVKNQICPKCGNELKLRSGKYGKFYGCSNYPYCKFTMKV
ncbi:topoisomerase DNA-binding C4 zinc finger domain-containing protein, partial [uncultured Treponema sp.]